MLGVMLAATLCGWAIQDRTVTLQHSSSRGIRPLWARGTGKCYPKQLSTPASSGLSNRGERGRARANLGTLQGVAPLGREGGTSSLIGFSASGAGFARSPSRAAKIEIFLQILDETVANSPTQSSLREPTAEIHSKLQVPGQENQPSCYHELIRHETGAAVLHHETC